LPSYEELGGGGLRNHRVDIAKSSFIIPIRDKLFFIRFSNLRDTPMTGGTLAVIRKTVEGGNIKIFNITECPHAME
jgi:hypothetical protein